MYEVKCDECKATIRETDSVRESAAGGSCSTCHGSFMAHLERAGVQPERIAAMRATFEAV